MTERTRAAAKNGQCLISRVPSDQIASSDTLRTGQPRADHVADVHLTERLAHVD